MFDKRLMQMCPESRKYIAGNILFQFADLCLNEAVILKSLKEEARDKTVVLVSHRRSTARIADETIFQNIQ